MSYSKKVSHLRERALNYIRSIMEGEDNQPIDVYLWRAPDVDRISEKIRFTSINRVYPITGENKFLVIEVRGGSYALDAKSIPTDTLCEIADQLTQKLGLIIREKKKDGLHSTQPVKLPKIRWGSEQ